MYNCIEVLNLCSIILQGIEQVKTSPIFQSNLNYHCVSSTVGTAKQKKIEHVVSQPSHVTCQVTLQQRNIAWSREENLVTYIHLLVSGDT